MNVVICGNFSQSWHTESHVAHDFEALGHNVARYDGGPALPADLVLLQGNGGVTPEWVRALDCPTAAYHLDLFYGLARRDRVGVESMWQCDTVFTPDGDAKTAEYMRAKHVNHHWMPAACVSSEVRPGNWRPEYDYDVVFVGSKGYHREWPWRQTLLANLARRYGDRFRHFGAGARLHGQDLNDLYATARVVVGDSLALPGHTHYWSDRFYETVGRGGFLIGPKVPGIEEHFTDGQHLRLYELGDWNGLAANIDYYINNPTLARMIANDGQEHVRKHHTYKNRAQAMLDFLQ